MLNCSLNAYFNCQGTQRMNHAKPDNQGFSFASKMVPIAFFSLCLIEFLYYD